MATKPTAPEREPLTERELGEVLMWLFTETGHSQHVDAFRRHKAAEKAAATRAEKKD